MHITAIVLAAGKGSRMNSEIPKQYMLLDGEPVLSYSLRAFQHSSVNDVVLVTGEDDVTYCKNDIVDKYEFTKVKSIVLGGTERYWSVKNGLLAAKGADYVLIHDAARPCLTVKEIENLIEMVKKTGSCTLGVPVKDTIKLVDEECYGVDTPPRKYLWHIQTPQTFAYKDIVEAYRRMEETNDTDITDDTMIVERYLGKKTKVIMGDYSNIKITTPDDLLIAQMHIKSRKNED